MHCALTRPLHSFQAGFPPAAFLGLAAASSSSPVGPGGPGGPGSNPGGGGGGIHEILSLEPFLYFSGHCSKVTPARPRIHRCTMPLPVLYLATLPRPVRTSSPFPRSRRWERKQRRQRRQPGLSHVVPLGALRTAADTRARRPSESRRKPKS